MSELMKTKEGEPFRNEHAAKIQQGILRNQKKLETKVVEVDGGWALEVAETETTAAVETEKRPKRIPLGTRNVLRYPERKGYVRRVVNDVDDNVQRHQRGGYEFVIQKDLPSGDPRAGAPSQLGTPVAKSVGLGTTGVLMEIKEEWYQEDQKRKQDEITAEESTMRKQKGGVEGGYGEITIGSAV